MNSVILAAGEGRRWRESGGTGPKQLAKLGNHSLLYHTILQQIHNADNQDICFVVLGYEAVKIYERITVELSNEGIDLNYIKFIYNPGWNNLGTAFTLLCVRGLIGHREPFLVSSGDQLVENCTYSTLLLAHSHQPLTMFAAGSTQSNNNSAQNVFIRYPSVPNNRLATMNQFYIYGSKRITPEDRSDNLTPFLFDMGAYLLHYSIFDSLEYNISIGNSDLTTILAQSNRTAAMSMYPYDRWANINILQDLVELNDNQETWWI